MVAAFSSSYKTLKFMVKKLITLLLFTAFSLGLNAQKSAKLIDWKVLAKVDYEDRYHEEYEAWYLYPIFSDEVKKLDGKQVIIKGYMIPLDVEGGVYALSAYPFSACFFCGGAGPESVMSLKFKGSPERYETDDVVTLTGVLELNNSNVDDFNYVLKNAEEVD